MNMFKRETDAEKVFERLKRHITVATFEDGYERTPGTDKPKFYDFEISEGSGVLYPSIENFIKENDKLQLESKIIDFCKTLVMPEDFDDESWYKKRAEDFVDKYKEFCMVEIKNDSRPVFIKG